MSRTDVCPKLELKLSRDLDFPLLPSDDLLPTELPELRVRVPELFRSLPTEDPRLRPTVPEDDLPTEPLLLPLTLTPLLVLLLRSTFVPLVLTLSLLPLV